MRNVDHCEICGEKRKTKLVALRGFAFECGLPDGTKFDACDLCRRLPNRCYEFTAGRTRTISEAEFYLRMVKRGIFTGPKGPKLTLVSFNGQRMWS